MGGQAGIKAAARGRSRWATMTAAGKLAKRITRRKPARSKRPTASVKQSWGDRPPFREASQFSFMVLITKS